MSKSSIAVIVLNWNDADLLPKSVGSLLKQSEPCDIIIVDNASSDNSREAIQSFGQKVTALWNKKNKGFAGGVNTGIRYALAQEYSYIALLNNDATADKDWVKNLRKGFSGKAIGATTCSFIHAKNNLYDSTGDIYTTWGLPYPRGRDEEVKGQYDQLRVVTSVSGGASMFRADFFHDVGLFDEDFFAYYEDVDLGIRGNLRGWRLTFTPEAVAYHNTGTTSSRVKGFTTYQTMKNLPWVYIKNVPLRFLFSIGIRLCLAYWGFFLRSFRRKQGLYAVKGVAATVWLLPKKLWERWHIQSTKKITDGEFKKLLAHHLPPNAAKLRVLQAKFRGKSA
jgi:GT2 family glycosyltransferase